MSRNTNNCNNVGNHSLIINISKTSQRSTRTYPNNLCLPPIYILLPPNSIHLTSLFTRRPRLSNSEISPAVRDSGRGQYQQSFPYKRKQFLHPFVVTHLFHFFDTEMLQNNLCNINITHSPKPQFILVVRSNCIWKGDVGEIMRKYSSLLNLQQTRKILSINLPIQPQEPNPPLHISPENKSNSTALPLPRIL